MDSLKTLHEPMDNGTTVIARNDKPSSSVKEVTDINDNSGSNNRTASSAVNSNDSTCMPSAEKATALGDKSAAASSTLTVPTSTKEQSQPQQATTAISGPVDTSNTSGAVSSQEAKVERASAQNVTPALCSVPTAETSDKQEDNAVLPLPGQEMTASESTQLQTQTPTDGPETAPSSKLGARFSVNLSGVGLPSMASNLGLTQANSERAADMAQDLKKNMVNMWHAWFPTPSPSSSAAASSTSSPGAGTPVADTAAALRSPTSGTQSLSHLPAQQQRPAKTQRMNSYTLGSKAGSESAKSLSSQAASSSSRGYSLDIPNRSTAGSPVAPQKNVQLKSLTQDTNITQVVHEANDPIAAQSSTCAPPPSNLNNGPIYLMGKLYPPSSTQWSDFQRDFTSGLIWCTYRHSYSPIRPSNFTTDVGWGCMLRSGQGLLANALAIQFLGRGWNKPVPGDATWDIYVRILSWFLDDMNAKSPFSVHRIALLGKQLGKNIGEWFGPSTTSQVTKALVHNFPESGLSVYVTTDGVVYKDQVEEVATLKNKGSFGHLLILVTIRLGIDKLNPIYNDAIKATFEFPQSLGIAGGRPSSSYYFVGYQGNDLFYLDPHHSRCIVETKDLNEYTAEDLATYHCETIRKIDINAIDPSMLLAFYCRDRAEFDAFCERVKALNARPGMGSSIFAIGEKAPDYGDDDDGHLLSVADEEDDDLELIL
ncbi:Cysteine protease atg4 [Haplosporangium sp. Z 767]|nr:Cysteine protease atg4 [Haplosporangium sp. Z 767]KAF9179532.1 Cysteine protease atg4 [Haplosporangium sp. Z 11]